MEMALWNCRIDRSSELTDFWAFKFFNPEIRQFDNRGVQHCRQRKPQRSLLFVQDFACGLRRPQTASTC